MTLVEDVKASVQRVSGWRRPSVEQLARLVQSPRIAAFRFRDDGFIPNSPLWPVVVYRSAVKLPRSLDPAAVWEALFESNGWGDTWRNGIYDYLHYHSQIHEVLGIARGSATVRLGGNKGRIVKFKAGDAVVIPAGTGHQCLSASRTFLVVGAYPPNGTYDECGPTVEEHDRNVKVVARSDGHARIRCSEATVRCAKPGNQERREPGRLTASSGIGGKSFPRTT